MALGRNRPVGINLEADDRDLSRALDQVKQRVRDTSRELEGSLGRALGDTQRDMGRLADRAPAVAASMLRLEDAQNQYNRALHKHGEESRQARLALARVADQQDKVDQASDRARRSLDRTNDQLERQGRVSAVAGKGLGAAKAGLIGLGAAAAYGAVRGIGASIKAASDLNEEVSKTKTVFGAAADEVIAFSETTADGLGISQRAALEAAGQFGNMLTPMGIARSKAGEMSTAMVQLAGDMASFNNASPEETLQAIQSGLAGETEPLRKYGVFLDAARIKAEALSSGLVRSQKDMVGVREAQVKLEDATAKLRSEQAKHGAGSLEVRKAQVAETKATRKLKEELKGHTGELTAAQKAQASYNLIMKDTTVQQGDAARTGDQLAGLQRRLSANTEELAARFGRKLLPSVIKVSKFVLDNWPKIEKAVDGVAAAAGGLIEFMANVVTGRWKAAWKQILSVVNSAKGPLATAAQAIGRGIAQGLVQGFDSALASVPGSGALRRVLGTGGAVSQADITRVVGGRGLSANASGTGGGGFATGGLVPGRYDGRDDVTVRVSRGEVILNPLQTAILGEREVMRVLAATGGQVGGTAFATGGYVTAAYQRARENVGEPYGKPSRGESRTGPNSWDCSGYATMIAGVNVGGTTASAYQQSSAVRDASRYPILWGFRKQHSGTYRGGYDEHMGVRVGGTWFQTSGGRTAQTGSDSSWSELRVPKGLENLQDADAGGGDISVTTSGTRQGPPPGLSAKQFRSAVDEARQTGDAGGASRLGIDEIPSIDRRHADDALQERVIRRRGGKDSDVYAFQRKEVERDILDVRKRIKLLVARRKRLVATQRRIIKAGGSKKTSRKTREALLERFTLVSGSLTETRDAIRSLQEMRRELVYQARILGFDVEDALADEAEEARQAAEDAAEDAASAADEPGLSEGQESALRSLGEWAQSGEAFRRAVSGAGDIGSGGVNALAAAFSPSGSVPITIQSFHPGDPATLRALASTVTRALGGQGAVPATVLATGA